jgi:ATPase family associated with various cellular activities (AAA)
MVTPPVPSDERAVVRFLINRLKTLHDARDGVSVGHDAECGDHGADETDGPTSSERRVPGFEYPSTTYSEFSVGGETTTAQVPRDDRALIAFLIERLKDVGDAQQRASAAKGSISGGRADTENGVPSSFERGDPEIELKSVILPESLSKRIAHRLTAREQNPEDSGADGFAARRRRGLKLLFWGEPGTGKTLAAMACAKELSAKYVLVGSGEIEDRYVGVAEERLTRLFREASRTGDVIILDECDSLIASRAVMMDGTTGTLMAATVNHLLRCIEQHEGVVILTTNRRPVLDIALKRRIDDALEFPMPAYEQRLEIWRLHARPYGIWQHVNLILCACFPLSGGAIQKVASAMTELVNIEPRRRHLSTQAVVEAIHIELSESL